MTAVRQVFIFCIGGFVINGHYYLISVKAVYNELHQTLMSINEQEDLKWWKNHQGPGMPTDWPKVEVCLTHFLHKEGAIYGTNNAADDITWTFDVFILC